MSSRLARCTAGNCFLNDFVIALRRVSLESLSAAQRIVRRFREFEDWWRSNATRQAILNHATSQFGKLSSGIDDSGESAPPISVVAPTVTVQMWEGPQSYFK